MTELKCKKVNINIITEHDFSAFVREYYNRESYEVVAICGWSNDTEHFFDIKKEKLPAYWYKNLFSSPQYILTDLCHSGVIEEGYYLIKVSW